MNNNTLLTTNIELLDEGEAFASVSLNPYYQWAKIVVTDDLPNANKMKIPKEEFPNMIRTGLFSPIKMAEKEISDGHPEAHGKPIGTIAQLLEESNKLIALAALWKKEKKVNDIAEDFGVTKSAVYGWIKGYKKQGLNGLKKKNAKGAEPKLGKNEIKKLLGMIEKTADNYGFESPLWDCKKITQLIKEKFGKTVHFSNVWRLLQRLGLSSQKPQRMAKERDEKEVKKWIKNIWTKILAHARRWQAMIYFQDESAVRLTAVLGTTWAKKGKTPIVRVTGKRGTIGITSAISPAGRMVFRLEKETIKAKQQRLKQSLGNRRIAFPSPPPNQ